MPDHVSSAVNVSLVLAGGIALGAYEAGAYAALHAQTRLRPQWLAGSSIGSVNAAVIAGTPPDLRVERLHQLWDALADDPFPISSFFLGHPSGGPWRQAQNDRSVADSLLYGRPGLFRPRITPAPRVGVEDVPAMFDLAPLRDLLLRLVDFELLNHGPARVSLCSTDVTSGDRVVFDTGRGDRIGVEHVLASCALLPLFAPIEIEGRLLADGCLAANTPVDLILDHAPDVDMLCFVVELFARRGSRPRTLAASANRAMDLSFGNQTQRILEGQAREHRLRRVIGALADRLPADLADDPTVAALLAEGRHGQTTVATLAYRAGLDEAGPFKGFDFSRATLGDRWRAGEAAMRDAVAAIGLAPVEREPMAVDVA